MIGRRLLIWAAATLVAAAGLAPVAAADPPRPPAGTPGFSIEQMVAARSIGQAVLAPDRKSIVYTHVGRYWGHPLFPAYGEDSNLFLKRIDSGDTIRLTSGSDATSYPTFSPDGRFISYERQGDIWTVEVANGHTKRLTTNAAADRSAVWSPDGREIAFVSTRWGRPSLYVMPADGERSGLRQVTQPGFTPIYPAWSADGRHLMFTAARDSHFYSRGLYRVPVAGGGEPERITPADDAKNAWPSVSPDGKRVAYISDRSGYLNIWTMNPDGSGQQQVTRAAEDQDYPDNDYIQTMGLRWSPDGKRILYFTNQQGNLRLRTVDVATGRTAIVENRDGSHHPVGWVDDRTVAYVYESYRDIPELYVKPLNGTAKRLTSSTYAVFGADKFDRLESVTWKSDDGVEVHGYLRRPTWAKAGDKLPALVLSHTYNVGQFYNQWSPIFSYLVQSGYTILTVNHRGSNGYGTKFRDLPKGDWGFAQLKDIESAAGYLRERGDVDADRVGMLGYSMGGYMTQLALTARPDLFRMGVAVFGLGEIVGDPQNSSPNYIWHLGGSETEQLARYRNASPVTHVPKLKAPIMIVHSYGDPIEPVTKIHNFTQAMDAHGKRYEVKLYENEAHGLRLLDHQVDSYHRIMAFIDRYLRP
ncbi:S9 family peptidase [Sphingoaurantiacus capsulatus]|uniref:Acyl-peptide hydrolase n=1 Tax=Sphingoaurantiacus capsulatus TaxID=1771310 RepID=A0ABV7XG19_9SPHN